MSEPRLSAPSEWGRTDKPVEAYQPEWALWVRQFVAVGLVIAGVYALTLLAPVSSILITTFLISFLMFIPARALARATPLNYATSVVLIVLIVLVIIIALIVVVVPRIGDLVRGVIVGLEDLLRRGELSLRSWDPAAGAYTLELLGFTVDLTAIATPIREALLAQDPNRAAEAVVQAQQALFSSLPTFDPRQIISTVTQIITSLVGMFTQFLSTVFLGLFLSLLILLELPNYQRNVLLTGRPDVQRENRLLLNAMFRVWQGFFNGQLLLCAIIGVITTVQLGLMGITGAVPLAFLVAVLSLIPTLGGILALIPLFVVPLLQGSTVIVGISNLGVALVVVIVNLVISQFIWNVIAPKIMGDALKLPLPAIIIGIIIGTAIGGALGAFLIAPALGTARVVVLYLLAKVRRVDPFPDEALPEIVDLGKI
jgi:predicted PurR-regulated permease PerM